MTNDKLREALLPCPFCGSEAVQDTVAFSGDGVNCSNSHCWLSTHNHVLPIRHWNRRALSQPPTSDEGAPLPDCMMPDGAEPCKGYQHLQGTLHAKERELAKLHAIPENAAISADGTVYYNITQLAHWAEEYECAMKCLDDANVPRGEQDGEHFSNYSLWGRIKQFAALQPTSAATRGDGGEVCRHISRLSEVAAMLRSVRNVHGRRDSMSADAAIDIEKAIQFFRATPPAATDGFVRVPREPTPEMIKTGREIFHLFVHDGCVQPMYKAMLAAAPTPSDSPPQEGKADDERRIKELASDIVNHAFAQPAGDFRASICVVEELLRLNWRAPPAASSPPSKAEGRAGDPQPATTDIDEPQPAKNWDNAPQGGWEGK